jgi:hypothetical protein
MKVNELDELGFDMVDENEYSNGDFTIFILSEDKISIIGENVDDFLSIPEMICKKKIDLIHFFKLIGYDIQGKNKVL